jgi:hypothetical protein
MTIRVVFVALALTVGVTAAKSEYNPRHGVMQKFSFGCPYLPIAQTANRIWDGGPGFDEAWEYAKPEGCLPYPSTLRVIVIKKDEVVKNTVCAVRGGEMGPCLWIPADSVKYDDDPVHDSAVD